MNTIDEGTRNQCHGTLASILFMFESPHEANETVEQRLARDRRHAEAAGRAVNAAPAAFDLSRLRAEEKEIEAIFRGLREERETASRSPLKLVGSRDEEEEATKMTRLLGFVAGLFNERNALLIRCAELERHVDKKER